MLHAHAIKISILRIFPTYVQTKCTSDLQAKAAALQPPTSHRRLRLAKPHTDVLPKE